MTNENISPVLEFRNVNLSFDDNPALVDVSFSLAKDEMIFITGISGAGKSVLLLVAMGLLKPDSGEVFINGREIDRLDESDLLAIRGGWMGMVFQEDSLFTGLTVYENAAYRLEEHGWAPEEIDKAVAEVLRFVGLSGEEEKLPEELSGGMKRRLEIARALIGWPSIMLFDEPTMGLDPIVAIQVLNLVLRARDVHKISSLYVTKKLHEVPYLANYVVSGAGDTGDEDTVVTEAAPGSRARTRVMVLDRGRIAFLGSHDDFERSELRVIKELRALDYHDHANDPYFSNPWDKSRKPKEEIL
jgi:phospholipid/cholesterol/gamma-HCH transport system ATP-binding protein